MYENKFPRMAAVVRDYLAIPASKKAIKRLFSRGRDLLNLRRHSLNAETVRKLILLKNMYQNKEAK